MVATSPDVGTALDSILSCLSDALGDAGRGVCRTGLTVGPAVLGPTACCASCDGETPGGQLTGTMQRMYPIDPATFSQQVRVEDCVPGIVGADLAFTLARCHPVINTKGVPPTLEDVAPYADGAVDDAQIMWLAFQCGCLSGMKLAIRDISVSSDPLGGCSGVGVLVTVLVKPVSPVVDVS